MASQEIQIERPVLVDRDLQDLVIDAEQLIPMLQCLRNRFMLGCSIQQRPRFLALLTFRAMLTNVAESRKNSHLNRFGSPAGEHDLPTLRREHLPN